MATVQYRIALARSLPPRLLRFFAKYPPRAIIPAANTTSNDPESLSPNNHTEATPSPFKAHKFAVTGRWHDPKFSLRRQAELVKLARQHGVEELLPHSVKGTTEKLRRREQNGLRVKGTGVGQKVKGKEWERTLKGRYVENEPRSSPTYIFYTIVATNAYSFPFRLEKRRQAMLGMPKMIADWKERGHGRGWKKWPK